MEHLDAAIPEVRTSWLHESINSFFFLNQKEKKRLFPVVTLVVRGGLEGTVEAEGKTLSSLQIFVSSLKKPRRFTRVSRISILLGILLPTLARAIHLSGIWSVSEPSPLQELSVAL